MIDFIKSLHVKVDIEKICSNEALNFPLMVDERTSEILKRNRTSEIDNLLFTLTPDDILKLQGSLHKFKNGGKHNFDNFTFNEFITVIETLKTRFDLLPGNIPLNNLEIGVNIHLPYSPSLFIDELIHYKNNTFNVTRRSDMHYAESEQAQYKLKIYNKGLQYGIGNILRFELRFNKMQSLNSKGIYNLSDLMNRDTWLMFGEMLRHEFNSIIYFDAIEDCSKLTEKEKTLLEKGNNPKYWKSLPNRTTKKNHSDQFRMMVNQYGKNEFHKIGNMITEKVNELLNDEKVNVFTVSTEGKQSEKVNDFTDTIETKHRTSINSENKGKLYEFTYLLSCKNVNPSNFYLEQSEKCLITGIDISMQKEKSKLLSHSGLKYYHEKDKISFEMIKRKYLSQKWSESEIDVQIKEIAHNIRNKYNNLKLKQRRLNPQHQTKIFQ
jgi:hypothetical protein